jgi:hypothetical protein
MILTSTEASRFDAKTRPGENGCIEWTGSLRDGYGQLHLRRLSAVITAHRISWMRHFGPIPDGMFVCHKCDNRKCVNPEHLFLGSAADNSADMVAKGRSKGCPRHGSSNPRAKLLPVEVDAIRLSTASYRELSKAFGISKSQIQRIKTGATWGQDLLPQSITQ